MSVVIDIKYCETAAERFKDGGEAVPSSVVRNHIGQNGGWQRTKAEGRRRLRGRGDRLEFHPAFLIDGSAGFRWSAAAAWQQQQCRGGGEC